MVALVLPYILPRYHLCTVEMLVRFLQTMLIFQHSSSVASFMGRNGISQGLIGKTFDTLSSSTVTLDNASRPSVASISNTLLDPLVVCGPSGVGKGTIIAKFMEEYGGSQKFGFSVSHTTRKPRPGELDGIHYHFTSIEAMRQDVFHGNKFIEHAEVHGNLYGTSWQTLRNVQGEGKKCLLDIDVQGIQKLKTLHSADFQPKYIFIAPPSLEVLLERLRSRATETADSLAKRTANAKMEVEYGAVQGNFDYVIVNDDLETACQNFKKAVDSLYDF